jgi:DNA replication licensing factor MCM6
MNKSIIRVEQPDVNFDEDEEMEVEQPDAVVDDETPAETEETPAAPKQKHTMTYDDYKKISNMIVVYMRDQESNIEGMNFKDFLVKSILFYFSCLHFRRDNRGSEKK